MFEDIFVDLCGDNSYYSTNGIYFGPDDNLYIASFYGDNITVMNKQNGKILRQFGVGDGVFGPDEHVIDVTEYLDHLDEDQGMAEADNMSTFEQAQCNQTMEGEYCPEHGLAECGNYGMYESELARIKSLALLK